MQFLGIVRDIEDGRTNRGIDYQAESQLAKLAAEGAAQFETCWPKLHQRLGFVSTAEPSVIIQVTKPHSQTAFDICQFYLRRLETGDAASHFEERRVPRKLTQPELSLPQRHNRG